ncbi:SDR family NAD(P)-dependent oxidoreductase [Actinokineospora auranticolor]|uniref:Alcohol dehydrogenase-like protein n=1 Tax=Actinokineospora auranticolor TaxID=155976 RepID=A0A2S6H163_9PSEU|nr:SDR family NAD(P)-dependent oxidoreductase [Actinokineospora auranticolor]PPK71222.1 alcohol dehydrogenase-like protein [Actinokineospora auranticolor]
MDSETPLTEPIAVIGLGCRYPGGVTSATDLWELVVSGGDGIGPFPTDRGWDLDALYDRRPRRAGRTYTREAGFLHDLPLFDADRYGISPRDALAMDPQQRLLLDVGHAALRHAGIEPESLRGTDTGVFAGVAYLDYGMPLHHSPALVAGKRITGSVSSVLSGRLAYTLDVTGPALTVDTACSSSLVAIHLAAASLRLGESTLALAGGVAAMCTPGALVDFAQLRGLAPDGRCKTFSDRADGTVWAEGAGVVVLERLSDARRHGHRVLAVLRGSATNSDGATEGLRTPSGRAQERVIARALADARLRPDDVDLVEAHGTGTPVGDRIEGQALVAAYGPGRTAPLWVGAVKSNIGHSAGAAGVAGVIKVVAAMAHGVLPRSLHVEDGTGASGSGLNDGVDWAAGNIKVLCDNEPWPDRGRPRRAGVSGFGISGTNAHLVLEQGDAPWPAEPPAPDGPRARYWLFDHLPLESGAPAARHPVLDNGSEDASGDAVFTGTFEAHPWLAEHEVGGVALLPASALLDCALHVGRRTRHPVVAELVLHAPVPVVGGEIRLTARPSGDGTRPLRVEARVPAPGADPESAQWTTVATGLLRADGAPVPALPWTAAWPPPGRPIDLDRLYRDLDARDYYYGPSLRALRRAWHGDDGHLYAESIVGADRVMGFDVHPALLDAAFQVLGDTDLDGVPHAFTGVRSRHAGARSLRLRITVADGEVAIAAADPDGHPVVVVESLSPHPPRVGLFTGEWSPGAPLADPGAVALLGDSAWVGGGARYPDLPALAAAVAAGAPVPDLVLVERRGAAVAEAVSWAVETVRAWLDQPWARGVLAVVTRGAAGAEVPTDLPGTAVWGLLRAARAEHPGRFAVVDRREPLEVAALAAAAVGEAVSVESTVLVPRTVPHRPRGISLPRGPWRLVPGPSGGVDDVVPEPADAVELGRGQVEVEVRAAGVSLRDLALVLGDDPGPGRLGSEAAGVVTRVGPGVTGFAPGERVFGLVPGSFATRAVTDRRLLARIPAGWSSATAAALPLAWLAAWHGPLDTAGPDRIGELLADLVDLAERDPLDPHPPQAWDIRELAEPLGRLRAGTHTGKLVVTVPSRRLGAGTVLITGGTGAVGRELARHLVRAHGVRHLLLVSRTADRDDPLADELAAEGAESVVVRPCDVTDREALADVLDRVPPGRPLVGVVHAATDRVDGALDTLTPLEVERALRPQVAGAWHLHELTAGADLDLFVLLSAADGVLGAAGTHLEALARHRRARGLAALSLTGGDSVSTKDFLTLFDRALRVPDPVLRPARYAPGNEMKISAAEDSHRRTAFPDYPSTAAENTTPDVLALVRREVATVLGHRDPTAVEVARPFRALGFDSLSAVELRNRLSAATGQNLPPTLVFDHPSPVALARHLATGRTPSPAPPPPREAPRARIATKRVALPDVDLISGWDYPGQ